MPSTRAIAPHPVMRDDGTVYEPPQTLARGDGVLGELALRKRGDGEPVYELIVNGVFLMDSAETRTERLLAEVLFDRHPSPRHVFVGGLGLGFTTGALLADERVERVDVAEIEPLLVEWLRSGLVPPATPVLADHRVRIRLGDVRDILAASVPGSYDAVLLDVDNGPDFLVHDSNASVYDQSHLRTAVRALGPGGMLAVWSAAESQRLADTMAEVSGGGSEEVAVDVERDGRPMTYHLYLATPATVG